LYNKPAGCGTSGGISYRNPTFKKTVAEGLFLQGRATKAATAPFTRIHTESTEGPFLHHTFAFIEICFIKYGDKSSSFFTDPAYQFRTEMNKGAVKVSATLT
jgi:hypothetical protein